MGYPRSRSRLDSGASLGISYRFQMMSNKVGRAGDRFGSIA
jgi:hypothetical protein